MGWTKVEGWWKDTGKPEDIFEANRLILDDLAHEIRDSYIGPYTSMGNNCEIINSEVEDSVLMDGAKLINARNIVDSMIGRGAVIENKKELEKKERGRFRRLYGNITRY